jgi:hypothetical protein
LHVVEEVRFFWAERLVDWTDRLVLLTRFSGVSRVNSGLQGVLGKSDGVEARIRLKGRRLESMFPVFFKKKLSPDFKSKLTQLARTENGEKKKPSLLSKLPGPVHENIYTVPNLLTFSRLLAAPAVGYLLVHHHHVAALSLFAYAGITDLVDGYIARRYNLQTVVGTIIDPAADKLLMTISVVCLALNGSMPGIYPIPYIYICVRIAHVSSMAGRPDSRSRRRP